MTKINLIHMLSLLIREYEIIHGKTNFEIIKNNNTFIFTKIDPKLLDILELKQINVIENACPDFLLKNHLAENLPDIFDIAWKGKEMIYYLLPKKNKNVVILINLKAIQENGKTVKLEGHCVPIETKGIDITDLFN